MPIFKKRSKQTGPVYTREKLDELLGQISQLEALKKSKPCGVAVIRWQNKERQYDFYDLDYSVEGEHINVRLCTPEGTIHITREQIIKIRLFQFR